MLKMSELHIQNKGGGYTFFPKMPCNELITRGDFLKRYTPLHWLLRVSDRA